MAYGTMSLVHEVFVGFSKHFFLIFNLRRPFSSYFYTGFYLGTSLMNSQMLHYMTSNSQEFWLFEGKYCGNTSRIEDI